MNGAMCGASAHSLNLMRDGTYVIYIYIYIYVVNYGLI